MGIVSSHPLKPMWRNMRRRCSDPRDPSWKYYGARGIKVCERWERSLLAFAEDMGPRPAGFQIDRINVDGDYEPGNCRWVSPKENHANRRPVPGVTCYSTKTIEAVALVAAGMPLRVAARQLKVKPERLRDACDRAGVQRGTSAQKRITLLDVGAVRQIRWLVGEMGHPAEQVAAAFDITKSHVRNLVIGKRWAHA